VFAQRRSRLKVEIIQGNYPVNLFGARQVADAFDNVFEFPLLVVVRDQETSSMLSRGQSALAMLSEVSSRTRQCWRLHSRIKSAPFS
jgi:hypothetical protein